MLSVGAFNGNNSPSIVILLNCSEAAVTVLAVRIAGIAFCGMFLHAVEI